MLNMALIVGFLEAGRYEKELLQFFSKYAKI